MLRPTRQGRINHQDKTFQDSSFTSGAAKTRHQAFSTWVRETRAKLLIWDVETQATTRVHQAMVGTLVEPASTTPQLSGSTEAQIQQISNQLQTLGSKVSILLARPTPNQAVPQAEKITTCRYCILLCHNKTGHVHQLLQQLQPLPTRISITHITSSPPGIRQNISSHPTDVYN